MKKWIIVGGIVGIGSPVIIIPILSYLIDFLGGPLSGWEWSLGLIGTILFPFGFLTMDINLSYTPYFFWTIYILAVILNIGLYVFLGYIAGIIVQAIRHK